MRGYIGLSFHRSVTGFYSACGLNDAVVRVFLSRLRGRLSARMMVRFGGCDGFIGGAACIEEMKWSAAHWYL